MNYEEYLDVKHNIQRSDESRNCAKHHINDCWTEMISAIPLED